MLQPRFDRRKLLKFFPMQQGFHGTAIRRSANENIIGLKDSDRIFKRGGASPDGRAIGQN